MNWLWAESNFPISSTLNRSLEFDSICSSWSYLPQTLIWTLCLNTSCPFSICALMCSTYLKHNSSTTDFYLIAVKLISANGNSMLSAAQTKSLGIILASLFHTPFQTHQQILLTVCSKLYPESARFSLLLICSNLPSSPNWITVIASFLSFCFSSCISIVYSQHSNRVMNQIYHFFSAPSSSLPFLSLVSFAVASTSFYVKAKM